MKLEIDFAGSLIWKNINNLTHRVEGPAIIDIHGTIKYFVNNICHREDGPAIICSDGTKYYYLNNELHRKDGPAIIDPNGYRGYFLDGIGYNEWLYWKKVNSFDF